MELRPINYPQALDHDFDAVVHVVPPGAAFSPYNPCCTGSFYCAGCTADCPSQQPVQRTTGDLGGFLDIAGGWQQFVPAIEPAAPEPEPEPPGRCGYCDGTGDVHSIDGEWRGVCTECEAGEAGDAMKASIAAGVAWRAYSKAWPESVCGYELIDGKDPASDPMPRHDYNWLTGEPAASQAEIDAWWARRMEHPKLDWGDAP